MLNMHNVRSWYLEAAPKDGQRKRDLEVERDHGGDYKSWLEHSWHKEKRSMDLDDLHKRWFSGDVREWFSKQKEVDIDFTGVNHHATVFQALLNSVYGTGIDIFLGQR